MVGLSALSWALGDGVADCDCCCCGMASDKRVDSSLFLPQAVKARGPMQATRMARVLAFMVISCVEVGHWVFRWISLCTDFTPGVARASCTARWISSRLSA